MLSDILFNHSIVLNNKNYYILVRFVLNSIEKSNSTSKPTLNEDVLSTKHEGSDFVTL